ncbi:MAG: TetR/AcrR family transcriptional regulator [Sporichthyaceae bacterium]
MTEAPEMDPRGRRLSAETIVAAAVHIIETEGEAAASMRRIASDLGVAAMSLYNHVPNKAALLEAVADWVGAQIVIPADADEDWGTRARTLLGAFRDVARQYPNCMQISMSRASMSPVGIGALEHALGMLIEAGFSQEEALRVVRTATSFVIGAITTDSLRQRAAATAAETGFQPLPPEQFPHLAALGPKLLEVDSDADFEFGVNLLMAAIGLADPARRP